MRLEKTKKISLGVKNQERFKKINQTDKLNFKNLEWC
jgi:hypothetical protein